jgi:Ca2+-binding RTX toxin-like protein
VLLDDAIFTAVAPGALAAGAFRLGTAQDADDRILYDSATGELRYDGDGSGGAFGAIHFATLQGAPMIGVGDFTVI